MLKQMGSLTIPLPHRKKRGGDNYELDLVLHNNVFTTGRTSHGRLPSSCKASKLSKRKNISLIEVMGLGVASASSYGEMAAPGKKQYWKARISRGDEVLWQGMHWVWRNSFPDMRM